MLSLPHTVGHAILAMSCLESCSTGGWRLARDISACTGISLPYVSKILHTLGRAGLVKGKRGYRGGFALTRPAEEISLIEVASVIDARTTERRCLLGLATCSDERACPAHEIWKVRRQEVADLLTSVTIADVARFEHCRRADEDENGSAEGARGSGPEGLAGLTRRTES